MRIGLDVRALQTQGGSETRGIGRYVAGIVESLAADQAEDRLVLLGLEGRPYPEGWETRFETVSVSGAFYERASMPLYMRLPKLRSSQALLGRFHTRAALAQRSGLEAAVAAAKLDVLHLPTAVDLGSFPGGDFKTPVVATFLDAIPLLHREIFYDTWAPFLQRFYDGQLADLDRVACVVAISEASRKDAIQFAKLSPERVKVVYPAISPAYGVAVNASALVAVRARYGLPGPFALFCSVPDEHKNPTRVVQAFARALPSLPKDARLAFVSPRGEPYEIKILDAARASGLSAEEVTITDRIPEADLVALFQAASLLVSPSLVEGFGLPAAQALASGTPAIVSIRGSQPEVVGDAGLTVDPEDVGAIAQAIVRLMTDLPLHDELARRGRLRADLFTSERQARELRAIYDSVVEGR